MPLINAGPTSPPGVVGTLANADQNLQASYAPPGPLPSSTTSFAVQTSFLSGNPCGTNPAYGSLSASSGDRRGGGLLNGSSGALLT